MAVTGSNGYLARAIVSGLSAEGYFVVGLQRTIPEKNAADADVTFNCDISKPEDFARTLVHLHNEFGPVYGLINCAWRTHNQPSLTLTRRCVEVGLEPLIDTMLVCQVMIQYLRKNSLNGSIVNISSMYGLVAPHLSIYTQAPERLIPPTYGVAKAGLIQFTRYMAVAYANHGIRVNCISPGAFPRPEVREDDDFVRRLSELAPIGRVGDPQYLIPPILYLLDERSQFTTGANLIIDGGWTIW